MGKLNTKIGDHFIEISYKSKNLKNIIEKYLSSFIIEDHQTPNLVIKIEDGFGVPFLDYEVKITKKLKEIIFERADYIVKVDSEYKSAAISVYDDLALKHALMNLFSSFIVNQNWGLLIHSSCVIEKRKAHIFAGQSGAGKSTAAKLSSPRCLLSDEATLVKITSKGVFIYNSPFRSELEAEPFEGSVELASIQLLHQALKNKRIRSAKSDALLHLMDKVFFWPRNQEETKAILKLMTMLVMQVPVYDLFFQKNNTFWELIS